MSPRRGGSNRGGRGGGKFKEFFLSVLMIIIIAGVVLAVARTNEIRNFNDAQQYLTAMSYNWEDCYPFSSGECPWWDERFRGGDGSGSGSEGSGANGDNSGSNGGSGNNGGSGSGSGGESEGPDLDVSPLAPEFGNGSHEDYNAILDGIDISQPNEDLDYDRTEYRHWIGSPCNTREEVLIKQGEDVETGDRCRVESGSWYDPFTGQTTDDSGSLDIDHIIPLGYADAHGANAFSSDRKEEFANDHINLRAVDAGENRSKGADGPDAYMPPNEEFHCEYSIIWIDTLDKYELSTTEDDATALRQALNTC